MAGLISTGVALFYSWLLHCRIMTVEVVYTRASVTKQFIFVLGKKEVMLCGWKDDIVGLIESNGCMVYSEYPANSGLIAQHCCWCEVTSFFYCIECVVTVMH